MKMNNNQQWRRENGEEMKMEQAIENNENRLMASMSKRKSMA
jgi:hypothetical protein